MHDEAAATAPRETAVVPAVDQANQAGNYVIPARAVGVVAAATAVACLTALAIVAAIQSADTLSTVALALAVLAFSIQIIVFIAQANSASQQMLRAEQLNKETSSILVDIQGTARDTGDMIRGEFRRVLDAFIKSAPSAITDEEAGERKEGSATTSDRADPELADWIARFTERLDRMETERAPQPTRTQMRLTAEQQARRARSRNSPEYQKLTTFPDDENTGKAGLEMLRSLSADARSTLNELAKDEVTSLGRGNWVGLPVSGIDAEATNELLEKQLAEKVRLPDTEEPVVRLTDAGRELGRFHTAKGVIPAWAADVV